MIFWILKTAWRQKLSLLASMAGVTSALILVIALDAIFLGESNKIVNYPKHMQPDIWVMQKGVKNMHMATTFLSEWVEDEVQAVAGVKRATPILYINSMMAVKGRELFSYIVGLTREAKRAGPWSVSAGKSMPDRGEVLVPQTLEKLFGLELGDAVNIAEKTFTVAGFTHDTFSMANTVVFIQKSDLEDILKTGGFISYLLVDIEAGEKVDVVTERIRKEVRKVSVLSHQEFINNDFKMAMMMGVELVSFMSMIGTALASLIIAFTGYTLVARNRKEIAIAKSMGFRNSDIYLAIIIQTMLVVVISLTASFIFCVIAIPLIETAAPQISMQLSAEMVGRIASVAIISGVLASLIPAYLTVNVEPVNAMRV